ncbi:MAG: hypothetical protein ACRC9N_12060 [Aeromonas sp.]
MSTTTNQIADLLAAMGEIDECAADLYPVQLLTSMALDQLETADGLLQVEVMAALLTLIRDQAERVSAAIRGIVAEQGASATNERAARRGRALVHLLQQGVSHE